MKNWQRKLGIWSLVTIFLIIGLTLFTALSIGQIEKEQPKNLTTLEKAQVAFKGLNIVKDETAAKITDANHYAFRLADGRLLITHKKQVISIGTN